MLRSVIITLCLILAGSLALAADDGSVTKAVANIKPSQAATTRPSNNNITGTVTFSESGGKVTFVADIDGLSPGKHGFHIHKSSDLSAPDLSSAGGHFNPDKDTHGGPESPHHHMGDLGNLTADDKGHAHAEGTLPGATLGDGDHSILGKSVIVHAKEDDLQTDPAGNSGGRMAGGVIEAAK
ncbi:MAG TPA: superoxide dismutase family protein [Tepidisphaeraceae bacterium]|nr:superoxide dismutase family protein [Tepidisphaeraceae bacterium]